MDNTTTKTKTPQRERHDDDPMTNATTQQRTRRHGDNNTTNTATATPGKAAMNRHDNSEQAQRWRMGATMSERAMICHPAGVGRAALLKIFSYTMSSYFNRSFFKINEIRSDLYASLLNGTHRPPSNTMCELAGQSVTKAVAGSGPQDVSGMYR